MKKRFRNYSDCRSWPLAGKMGNKLVDDEWWKYVKTLGSGAGIDRMARV